MDFSKQNRLIKVLFICGIVLACGIIYYLLTLNGISIPCYSYQLFGIYCPGCGITRMFQALINLDFMRAFQCNAAFLITLPLWILLAVSSCIKYINKGSFKFSKWQTVILVCCAIVILVFGVLRNFEPFYFLRP